MNSYKFSSGRGKSFEKVGVIRYRKQYRSEAQNYFLQHMAVPYSSLFLATQGSTLFFTLPCSLLPQVFPQIVHNICNCIILKHHGSYISCMMLKFITQFKLVVRN